MLIHRKATTNNNFAGINFYTWVERGTVRFLPLEQHNNNAADMFNQSINHMAKPAKKKGQSALI